MLRPRQCAPLFEVRAAPERSPAPQPRVPGGTEGDGMMDTGERLGLHLRCRARAKGLPRDSRDLFMQSNTHTHTHARARTLAHTSTRTRTRAHTHAHGRLSCFGTDGPAAWTAGHKFSASICVCLCVDMHVHVQPAPTHTRIRAPVGCKVTRVGNTEMR